MGFQPALLRCLRGYDRRSLLADLGAGLTVGLIALPLAIGFAIASGVKPERGLWTAIVAGFLVSALGGTRQQIAGPTGAFVPVLALIVVEHGYEGLALATMMAGAMLVIMGVLKLGNLIKFIPYPVVAGFTSGIAVIIFTQQLNEFLGLGLKMPSHALEQMQALAGQAGNTQWPALAIGAITIIILMGLPKVTKRVPPSIVAVVLTTVLAKSLALPVATIASKFGEIPAGLPGLHIPTFTLAAIHEMIGPAFTIAVLGAIESLLSAMVADGMADTRHDSNQELTAQGIANICSPLVGGIAATGAIARTAANVRSGARTPVSGIIHSLVLLAIVMIAAPFAKHIPLACLSAVLMVVAVRMAEWDTFPELWRGPKSDFFVMLIAFVLTVVFDLTVGVGVGLVMAAVLFVKRMEDIADIHLITPDSEPEPASTHSIRGKDIPSDVVLYRLEGPFFFAAVDKLEAALRGSGGKPRAIILRMRNVPSIDASGLHALEIAVEKMRRDGVHIYFTAVQAKPLQVMQKAGLADIIGREHFCADIDEALAAVAKDRAS